jgi:hypothetical protein
LVERKAYGNKSKRVRCKESKIQGLMT